MFQVRLSGPAFRPSSSSVRDAVLFVLAVLSSQLLRVQSPHTDTRSGLGRVSVTRPVRLWFV